jgi:FKBP-type peptidyl-prolyl cis-trans isomerase
MKSIINNVMKSMVKVWTYRLLGLCLLCLTACAEPSNDGADATGNNTAEENVAEEATIEIAAAEVVEEKQDVDEGTAYLLANAQKEGVTVTGSGLQYEVLNSGDGASPSRTSKVVTHYHGTFINGEVFDSSVERGTPAEFPVNRVIKGWTEALQMMREGDKWRLVIPSELAYGERGAGGGSIPPNTVLIFEVELIEVK